MRSAIVLLALAIALAGPLAGCFKKADLKPAIAKATPPPIDERGRQALDQLTKPLRWTFGAALPAGAPTRVVTFFNGTVGQETDAAVEDPQDRGGTSFNAVLKTQDFSKMVPPGVPTLVSVRLWFDNKPGASVDLDVYVDAFGAKTHEAREYSGEMAWTLPVKTQTFTTVGGVAPTIVGVQAANGRIAPGQEVPFWMRVQFDYGADVAAPKVPYALRVPANASGLIVESIKFAGDTHVKGHFLVISPQETLVAAVEFDDIAIPTQSVFVPLPGPGEYVFYVVDAKNGFFAVRADAPLDVSTARALTVKTTDTVLISDPIVPGGIAQHDEGMSLTPYQEGTSADFAVQGAFPLEIHPFIQGDGATGDVELRVTSTKGLVAEYHRFLRYDSAAQGTIGVSNENLEANRAFHPENLAPGTYHLSAVVNGMQGQAGVRVVTYAR